jgi:hypothetical protein
MSNIRNWETIKEYEDIFFDYSMESVKLQSTANGTGMLSGQPQ